MGVGGGGGVEFYYFQFVHMKIDKNPTFKIDKNFKFFKSSWF